MNAVLVHIFSSRLFVQAALSTQIAIKKLCKFVGRKYFGLGAESAMTPHIRTRSNLNWPTFYVDAIVSENNSLESMKGR